MDAIARLQWQPARLCADAATVGFLTLAALCATALRTPVILFPELAALTFVVMTKPDGPWARAPLKLILTPSLVGALGLLAARYMDYGLASVLVVVFGGITVLRAIRSPVVPALSAGLLPLVFGITDWSYLLALIIALSALALIAVARTRFFPPATPVAEEPPPVPLSSESMVVYASFVLLAYAGVALTGSRLVLYPPLAVAAYQMLVATDACLFARRPFRLIAICGLTAVAGFTAFSLLGHSPFAVAAASSISIVVVRWLDLMVPPALAVALIPWLLTAPEPTYPLAVALGTTILTLTFLASRPLIRRFVADGGAPAGR